MSQTKIDPNKTKSQKILGVFALAMINVAAIVSLRNFSLMVEYGFSSIFYYLLGALVFFIPSALICAELATGWPKAGGIYAWVSEAFGKKVGFFTVWISWMISVSWFPTVLTFTAAGIAYLFAPELTNNPVFMVATMLSVFWAATFINFLGMNTSSLISSIGAILGTIIPGCLIILLGAFWYAMGKPIHFEISMDKLIPDLNIQSMVFFAGLLLSLAGMEISAFHAKETKNPQRDFPKAILVSTFLILLISILGTLAIALVVRQQDLNLYSGILQAFNQFFTALNISWALPVIAFFAVIGSLAGINTWIAGPAKGILAAANDGFLPPFLHKVNKNNMPVGAMLFQAVAGSFLAIIFLFMPDVNTAFWIITALTIQFAMLMYILVFAAAIYLRYSQPEQQRSYKIPGGKLGMWLVGGIGLLSAIFAFFIAFLPPSQLNTGSLFLYEGYLISALVLLSLPPLIFIKIKKPSWHI